MDIGDRWSWICWLSLCHTNTGAQWRKSAIMGQKVRLFLLCSVTFFLLMLQNFPICHLKGLSNAFQNIWSKKYIFTILLVQNVKNGKLWAFFATFATECNFFSTCATDLSNMSFERSYQCLS